MLAAPELDIVRRDSVLPGLALLLDPEAFADTLSPFLESEVASASIRYIRYKPKRSCLVLYRLEAPGVSLDVYARAHPASARATLSESPGRILLRDRLVMAYLFPHDKKLRMIAPLSQREKRKQLLRKLVSDRADLWECELEGLRYIPERRFVAKLTTSNGPMAALKVYNELEYKAADGNVEKFQPGRYLRFARRLGKSKGHRTVVYQWLAGRLLSQAILDPRFDCAPVTLVGAALAELHTQQIAALPSLSRKDETATLFPLAEHIGFVCPPLVKRAKKLAHKLADLILQEPLLRRPIHGDFYAKQVLIAGEEVGVIDFDRAVLSDSSADLGNFIAHLEHKAISGILPRERIAPLQNALLDGYRYVTRTPLTASIELYTAAGLFRLAPDPFRYREQDWPELTEAILEKAEEVLGSAPNDRVAHRTFQTNEAKEY